MKAASFVQSQAINQEINRLRNINDALADLALAESVHQVVQANYDRTAGTLETYSKGNFPQTPEVIKTPRSGVTLTHRFGIHLDSDAAAGNNFRAKTEPAINDFVTHILPSLDDIKVRFSINDEDRKELSIGDLDLEPIDLLYIINVESDKNLTALDDYILKWIYENENPRPDANILIHYTDTEVVDGKFALFQILPLIKDLRGLILSARPLKSEDIQLPNEALSGSSIGEIEKLVVESTFNGFKDIVDTEFKDNLISEIENPAGFGKFFIEDRFDKTNEINSGFLTALDTFIDNYIDTLYQLNQFGLIQTGFGYIYDRKKEIYTSIYKKVEDYHQRWVDKFTKFEKLIRESKDIALGDAEKIDLLRKAERTISTSYTIDLDPVSPVDTYRNDLENNKKTAFSNKLGVIKDWLDNNTLVSFESIVAALNNLKDGGNPLINFDLLNIETDEEERQIVILAEDIVSHVLKFNKILDNKILKIQALLVEYDQEGDALNRTKILTTATQKLFGEEFKIIPKFELGSAHRDEVQKCFDNQEQILTYQIESKDADFPVDDWLYGIARVREKLGGWENLIVLSEQMNDTSLELNPLQFPYQNDDSWLALEFPENFVIDKDKLLYTAYFHSFDSDKKQCGLMVDEWTEVIPSSTETTGLSFQYDQPNTEPPQAMLLGLPSTFTGSWDWDDLVGTLHEALDLAKLRAIEPEHIEQTPYSQFLPATVSSVTSYPFTTMALNYALNNGLKLPENEN